jgi:hypothetical protein
MEVLGASPLLDGHHHHHHHHGHTYNAGDSAMQDAGRREAEKQRYRGAAGSFI